MPGPLDRHVEECRWYWKNISVNQKKLLFGRSRKIDSRGLLLVPLFCKNSDPCEAIVSYIRHGQRLMVPDEKVGQGVTRG